MAETILITGGAGFIGRHVTAALLQRGHRVRVLDSFHEQVHGSRSRAKSLRDAELMVGDVRDAGAVRRALGGVDSVIHLAAEVGVGQSMYAVERYVAVNELGTAVLFQELIAKPVRRVVVASSMSVYGEGLYRDAGGALVQDAQRHLNGGPHHIWDPVDAQGRPLVPVPTPEWKQPALASVYALNKYAQERMTLMLTAAYGMEGVALRLWNAYGPGQALSNPYTGVLAIFASRLLNRKRPLIFEDGQQRRDFVHIGDVAQAFVLATEHSAAPAKVYNVGSGRASTVREVAAMLARAMGRPEIKPEMTGNARIGDIRHCIPDIGKIRAELGYRPRCKLEDGLAELAEWVARQKKAQDRVPKARAELESRGLVA